MMSPVFNEASAKVIARLKTNLPQALLLEGMEGVGLGTAASTIAGKYIAGYCLPTAPDGSVDESPKGVIRVAQIRELAEQVRTVAAKKAVIIIDNADRMNTQAQNAFLKLLEEPNSTTHFILTSHHAQLLLPTILSRVQRITIRPILEHDSLRLIKKLGIKDARAQQQLLFLASGRPAEIARLASNPSSLEASAKLVSDARTLLQGKPYERTIIAFAYASDKAVALKLLETALMLVRFSLHKHATKELVQRSASLLSAYEAIASNGNVRLQLMQFVLQ
ncbi:MAG: AAA family ATPase [Candidatus Saccharimonas sp.]